MKFTAAGDMIIQQRIPEHYEGFSELAPFIRQGDGRFFNLETTVNREGECCASQYSGGTYLRCNPEALEDTIPFGFNLTTFNNNHVMDFFYTGLEHTCRAAEACGFVHAGVGRDLAEAAAPAYLETKNGKVALIAVTTSFEPSAMAGAAAPRVAGRPGINGIRIQTRMELPAEDLALIRRIAAQSGINAQADISRSEGYRPALREDEAVLGELKFTLGDAPRFIAECNKKDLQRVEEAILQAKKNADYIIISVHCHQVGGKAKEEVPQFLKDFSHFCIDTGANAVLGHGPHLLRPMEVYKDSPIFYSLGDFVLQLYSMEFAPAEFYEKYDLPVDATMHELLKKRSKNFTVGLMEDSRMSMSVIPLWETEGTKLKKLTLLPIQMEMKGDKAVQGLPRRADGKTVCDYLAPMCEPYGTKVTMQPDGLLSVTW